MRARAWHIEQFLIDNACQLALILRLVYQLLMPVVAELRVICGSCSLLLLNVEMRYARILGTHL